MAQLTASEVQQYADMMSQLESLQIARKLADQALYQRLCEISLRNAPLILKVYGSPTGLLAANGYYESPADMEMTGAACNVPERRRRPSQWVVWDVAQLREQVKRYAPTPCAIESPATELLTELMEADDDLTPVAVPRRSKTPPPPPPRKSKPAPEPGVPPSPAITPPPPRDVPVRARAETVRGWIPEAQSPQGTWSQPPSVPNQLPRPPRTRRRFANSLARRRP